MSSYQCNNTTDDRHSYNYNNNLEEENNEEVREGIIDVTNKSNANKSITNIMSNVTTAHPYNDTDDNKSSDVQEEEVKEKSTDVANNHKLTSNNNNYNVMLFIYIAHK